MDYVHLYDIFLFYKRYNIMNSIIANYLPLNQLQNKSPSNISSGSRIWPRGDPSSGLPNFANLVEQSHASEASICRHGVWDQL